MTPLNSWMEDFEAATGRSNVNIVAGYRSLDYQQQLYDAAVQNHGSDYAASYLAQPGCSEHHTGLAIDFALYLKDSGATADFTAPAITPGWWSTPGNTALSAAILRTSGT